MTWASDKRRSDGKPSAYGYHVILSHPGEYYETWYCHLAGLSVQTGGSVGSGQILGPAGSTGNSTGVHLHFNMRKQGHVSGPGYVLPDVVDPAPLLGIEPPPPPAGIDLRRFMLADKTAFRVVRMPDGRQEDIQDMDLGGGSFVRRKNDLGEWWRVDGQFFYLIHDTSPDVGGEGVERVYTLTKGSLPGAPKNPLSMTVGQSWQEAGTHYVQLRAKEGCRLLSENSGFAQNTAVLVDHKTNYTFNAYGQGLTFDEVVWIKTGVEMQIYGRKDGKAVGWIGWEAPWGKSEPVEVHWDRPPMTAEPKRYCSW